MQFKLFTVFSELYIHTIKNVDKEGGIKKGIKKSG